MNELATWQGILLAVVLGAAAVLAVVWWRQQEAPLREARWLIVVAGSVLCAPLLSWWSGMAFEVADYRAGCDGLCLGFRGAPVPFFRSETAGGAFMAWRFLLNTLIYLVLLLVWSGLVTVLIRRIGSGERPLVAVRVLVVLAFWLIPLALSPRVLPAPAARVAGDALRVAINAERETYLYDQLAPYPVLAVALEDVRPRTDGQAGLRVCQRLYSYFYLPIGYMYLDMTQEGVHSNNGGVLPLGATCWE